MGSIGIKNSFLLIFLSNIYFTICCLLKICSCLTDNMDLPDPLPPPVPIIYRFWQVFKATSCISTELLYIVSSRSSCLCSSMSSSLLRQQCPACLVHLTWIVFMMGGRWPYSCCFVECCLQDLFNIARNILV